MPPPYIEPHYATFTNIPHQHQAVFGRAPQTWVDSLDIDNVPDQGELPQAPLTRHQVRDICTNVDNHVLFAYVCAMAWGLQGVGVTRRHAINAWNHLDELELKLEVIRQGGLSRLDAYELFIGDEAIPGLGPAYFTKLLYFFSPETNFYIMDQWTAKSVNLLTGEWTVRMNGDAVARANCAGNYQAYCEEVDALAVLLGGTGAVMEERLFSQGGRNRWPWRAYVKQNWPVGGPQGRYSRQRLAGVYPHIPVGAFEC